MHTIFKYIVVSLLRSEAKLILRKYNPKIIAVTGSVGKTSTKDAIYTVVTQVAHVRKSDKSFNSDIGIPLTILGLSNAWSNPLKWAQNLLDGLALYLFSSKYPGSYPEWLILEVGADRPGDIKSLVKWLKADIVVITRLPDVPVHVEFFDSVQDVIDEKASLINTLKPDGTLILYGDEPSARNLRTHPKAQNVLTFGFSEGCDIRGTDAAVLKETVNKGKLVEWPLGMRANIHMDGATFPVEILGAVGDHVVLPALAAAAVAKVLGRSGQDIAEAVAQYRTPPGRMHLIRGIKDSLIVDDTYNSSPAASIAALDALAHIPHQGGRKIAIMGDMLELGRYSFDEHRKVGAYVAKIADMLVTIGFRARDIAASALDNGMTDGLIFQYEDSDQAKEELKNMILEGDLILIKGSQSMRMEVIVAELMAEPEQAKKELVRQDVGWTNLR